QDFRAAVAGHVLAVREVEAARLRDHHHARPGDDVGIDLRRLVEPEIHFDHLVGGVETERIDDHRHVGPARDHDIGADLGHGCRAAAKPSADDGGDPGPPRDAPTHVHNGHSTARNTDAAAA